MGAIQVLDHGRIELLDLMGNDDAIVDAARVSVAQGTKKQPNASLLRHLFRHKHTSPFEMCELKFRIKAPIFVARQWMRHRTGSINEWSFRYSVAPTEYYIPSPAHIGTQDEINKQGSIHPKMGSEFEEGIAKAMDRFSELAHNEYHAFIDDEVARETARIILPVNTYTEWIWKVNLKNLLHFLELRMDMHAQYEIRVYADAIFELLKGYFPRTIDAFQDYVLDAVTLNALDIEVLKKLQPLIRKEWDDMIPFPDPYQGIHYRWTKGDIRESKERLWKLGLLDEFIDVIGWNVPGE